MKLLNKLKPSFFWIAILILLVVIIKSYIQTPLEKWRDHHNVSGMIAMIQSDNKNKTKTSGEATTDTLFYVGSITKTFVSAAILTLESEGKLNINNKINEYFPDYPKWKDITIEQLLNMTSGIPNFGDDPTYKKSLEDNFKNDAYSTQKLIDIAYQATISGKKSWQYSNTNYLLLGEIIEKVSGKKLAEYFEEKFFKPLQLNHTFYSDIVYPNDITKKLAHGYYNGADMTELSPENYGAAGGAMVMNISDLQTWTKALFVDKKVLPEKQMTEMLTTVPVLEDRYYPENTQFGLGILVSSKGEPNEMIWYAGVLPGYTAMFAWMPQQKTLVVAEASMMRIGDEDFDILFPNQFLNMLELKND